jgi:hypothetical protein
MTAARWVFVSTVTDTVEEIDASAYLVDIETLSDDDAQVLADADSVGVFGPAAAAIVERVGLRVVDLLGRSGGVS